MDDVQEFVIGLIFTSFERELAEDENCKLNNWEQELALNDNGVRYLRKILYCFRVTTYKNISKEKAWKCIHSQFYPNLSRHFVSSIKPFFKYIAFFILILAFATLRYSNIFTQQERQVELSGEDYFEVSPNNDFPFVVKPQQYAVSVLGAKFNICANGTDSSEFVTQDNGFIEVTSAHKTYRLPPGSQFGHNGREAVLNEDNFERCTSWKDGAFRFQNICLGELCSKIQRWHNIEFHFVDETCEIFCFTSSIGRDVNLDYFITLNESINNIMFISRNEEILNIYEKNIT